MAAFAGSAGRIVLVRNHELTNSGSGGPFGNNNQLLNLVPSSKLYDYGNGNTPSLGGTTSVVFDPQTPVDPHSIVQLLQSEPRVYRLDGNDKLRLTREMPEVEDRASALERLLDRLGTREAA